MNSEASEEPEQLSEASAESNSSPNPPYKNVKDIIKGFRKDVYHTISDQPLSNKQVLEFENRVLFNPDDSEARVHLAYHYRKQVKKRLSFFRSFFDLLTKDKYEPVCKQKFREHVLWIFKNRPLSPTASDLGILWVASLDPETARQASEIWQRHAEENTTNARILSNAGFFFLSPDLAKFVNFQTKAAQADPGDPHRWRRLAVTFSALAKKASNPESRQKAWQKVLYYKEQELEVCEPRNKLAILIELSNCAANAGDFEKSLFYEAEVRKMGWTEPL